MTWPFRALVLTALVLFGSALARDAFDIWVDRTELPPLIPETSTEVRDRNGDLLRVYTVADGRWRLGVAPGQVDPGFLDMLIAYEDKRFYRHNGVDPRAMLRAAGQSLWTGDVVSGASTLSMQVARLLENSGTGRLSGKLRQMRVALALERELTKKQILALYLTHAPYGGNIEGVRAATLSWFGKEPKLLTPAESALLVALPQSPVARRPDRNPDAARRARDRVLDRVARTGALDRDEARAALFDPVPNARRAFPALAPHISDRAVASAPARSVHRLTLDADLQAKLERLARDAVRGLPPATSVAIVVADHRSGEILASVGSAAYSSKGVRQGFVDMTTALRSPGSTLKPVVYALAFDRGLAHPQTLIDDRPVAFGSYAPQNFDGRFRGELTAADALRQSLNIPVVLLLDEVGPAHLMDTMRRAGMTPAVPGDRAGLAVGLGGVGVTLTEMTGLYAALAQGGIATPLRWTFRRADTPRPRLLGRAATWHVGDILSDLAPPPGAPRGALAYKTGTSYGHRDAWALGFDGRHVAGVWIGRPDGTPVPGAFGGDLAAPILFDSFQRLGLDPAPLAAPPPDALIVSTGRLPQPLRRFRGRNATFEPATDAPKLVFPPDGARLVADAGNLPVKVRDGTPPFTWLANGRAVLTGSHLRDTHLPGMTPGFSNVSVIDAKGRAARVSIRVD